MLAVVVAQVTGTPLLGMGDKAVVEMEQHKMVLQA